MTKVLLINTCLDCKHNQKKEDGNFCTNSGIYFESYCLNIPSWCKLKNKQSIPGFELPGLIETYNHKFIVAAIMEKVARGKI